MSSNIDRELHFHMSALASVDTFSTALRKFRGFGSRRCPQAGLRSFLTWITADIFSQHDSTE
eukprot:5711121-Pyramimonas_sp.AAC.1